MALIDSKYYNRDLSWLRFNHRVLQEAADKRNPLYERIKFLAIFCANFDEFFEVRVSAIRRIRTLKKPLRKKLITKPNKLLRQIKKEVQKLFDEFWEIFENQITPALNQEGIFIIAASEYNEEQQQFATSYYNTEILNHLTLNLLNKGDQSPLHIENERPYLVALNEKDELIWVKIPSELPRFVSLPSSENIHQITFIDDIIIHQLTQFYQLNFYAIKVSRDAELYIKNEYSGDLLEKIMSSLPNRNTGQVTRVVIDRDIPDGLLAKLKSSLDIDEIDLVRIGKYNHLKDLFSFPNPTTKRFSFDELPPKRVPQLLDEDCILSAILKKDRLLYFPYESFEEVVRLVHKAADDPDVQNIKITLYRVSNDSAVAKGLLRALEKGKSVCIFIETKARFDEANNFKWGKILEQNGASVRYSYPGIKVHSKILYIDRIINGEKQQFVYIGTGNFNEKTSKIYTDFGLMTASPKLTNEVLQVFKVLEGKLIIPKTADLIVSPFSTRAKFAKLIKTEITNAQNGQEAYIILKLNSLQDKKMIKMLYKANNAGVKIRLLVRGICCLVAGVEGQSENIYVTSIVDRFLEHARVYIFANGGKEKMYMGSADWMTRNIDHRIEVITPVLDAKAYNKMRKAVQLQLEDNVKSRIIDAKQQNEYVNKKKGKISSQHLTYTQI